MKLLFAAIISLSLSCFAEAEVIDFDSISVGVSNVWLSAPYVEDGYVFDVDSTISLVRSTAFGIFGTDDPGYTGDKSVFMGWQGPVYTLARADGGLFDLTSMDIWEWRNQPGFLSPNHASVTFTGRRSDGSTVQRLVTANGVWDRETFDFPGFSGLTRVEWDTKDGLLAYFQLDNVVVSQVPEPQSLVLLLVFALAAPWVRKLRRV